VIRIDKWAGLVTNASQYAIPPGAAVEQVNLQCLVPGQMTVRAGMQAMPVRSIAPTSIVVAVRYEHKSVEQIVFQDSSGDIYSSVAVAAPSNVSGSLPGDTSIVTAVPGDAKIDVTATAVAGTGYSWQLSRDGQTGTGAGSSSLPAISLAGLTNAQKYYVRVAAVNASGLGPYTEWFGPLTPVSAKLSPASAPPLLVANATAALTATVLWQSPADNGGSPVTGYRLESSANAGATWVLASSPTAGEVSAVISGLNANATYVFRVAAVTAFGTGQYTSASAPVAIYGAQTPPSEPRSVSAVPSTTSIVLTWQPPANAGSSAVIDYTIKYGSQTATASGTTYTITGLTPATSYSISIAARSSAGTGAWATPAAVTTQSSAVNTAPSAVTALALTRTADGFTATWTAPAFNGGSSVTGYILSTATSEAGTYTTRYQNTIASATVTGLTAGTLYYVRVVAVNAVGNSAPASGSVTPGQNPSAPTALAATYSNGSSGVVGKFSWTAPASLYGSPILYYEVATASGADAALLSWISVSGNITSTTFSASIGQGYTLGVRAVTAAGTSSAASINSTVPDINASPLPGPPLNLAVVPASQSLTVTWEPPAYAGTTPLIRYRVTLSAGKQVVVAVAAERKVTYTALTNGTSYIVSVVAENTAGSGEAAVSPPAIPFAQSGAPGNGWAANLGAGRWVIGWTMRQDAPWTGGLPVQRYGVRSNIGLAGEYAGGSGLIAETVDAGADVTGTTLKSALLSYTSNTPGSLAADGSTSGRFDVYAVTAGGSGLPLTIAVDLPEVSTPPALPAAQAAARASSAGVADISASVRLNFPVSHGWKVGFFEVQYSYDGVTYTPFVDRTPPAIAESLLYQKINFRVYSSSILVRVPYNASRDPGRTGRHAVYFRVSPYFQTTFDTAGYPFRDQVKGAVATSQCTLPYAPPDAPKNLKTVVEANGITVFWDAPDSDNGSGITTYRIESLLGSDCNASPATLTITPGLQKSFSQFLAWDGTATLRWRVGATNELGTTYSSYQYQIGKDDVLLGTYVVDGKAGYRGSPKDTALRLPINSKVRILASGSVTPNNTPTGPDGITQTGGQEETQLGALMRSYDRSNWTLNGSCSVIANTGVAADGGGQLLFLGIWDNAPSNNTGSFDVAVIAMNVAISAPRFADVKINGTTVYIRALPPTSTAGLTVTKYRLQSSLDNSKWSLVAEQTAAYVSGTLTGCSFVAANQPAGAVYYRITCLAGTLESAPLDAAKVDTVPGAPTAIGTPLGGYGMWQLEWSPPAYDGGFPVTSYVIEQQEQSFSVTSLNANAWRIIKQNNSEYGTNKMLVSNPSASQSWTYIRIKAVSYWGSGPYFQLKMP